MIDKNDPLLQMQLKLDEGVRAFPYRDSVGKLTIGVGRNLDDRGISAEEIDVLLSNDIKYALEAAQRSLSFFDRLSDERQRVVVNMIFNLGLPRFLGFQRMIKCLECDDYLGASREMLDSKWSNQVGIRAQRLAQKMRRGV